MEGGVASTYTIDKAIRRKRRRPNTLTPPSQIPKQRIRKKKMLDVAAFSPLWEWLKLGLVRRRWFRNFPSPPLSHSTNAHSPPFLFFFWLITFQGRKGHSIATSSPPFCEIYFPAASPREGRWGEHLTLFIKKVYGKKGGVGLLIGRFNGALKIRDRELP